MLDFVTFFDSQWYADTCLTTGSLGEKEQKT